MNFDEALRAHVSWKTRLANYVRHPDRSLDANEVCLDDHCALGKWIRTEAHAYASLPEYQTLQTRHAAFHRAAAEVIRHADRGENVSDQIVLGADTPFSLASTEVVSAIMGMKHKI